MSDNDVIIRHPRVPASTLSQRVSSRFAAKYFVERPQFSRRLDEGQRESKKTRERYPYSVPVFLYPCFIQQTAAAEERKSLIADEYE